MVYRLPDYVYSSGLNAWHWKQLTEDGPHLYYWTLSLSERVWQHPIAYWKCSLAYANSPTTPGDCLREWFSSFSVWEYPLVLFNLLIHGFSTYPFHCIVFYLLIVLHNNASYLCENLISLRRNTFSHLCAGTGIALNLQRYSFLKATLNEIKVIARSRQTM